MMKYHAITSLMEQFRTVALIERERADTNRWIHIPATFFKALQSQDADSILSEADPSLDGANYPVPQGRVLGGGSSVNGMIYMRGQQQDYDDWAARYGCTGWAYKDVLPVFHRQMILTAHNKKALVGIKLQRSKVNDNHLRIVF